MLCEANPAVHDRVSGVWNTQHNWRKSPLDQREQQVRDESGEDLGFTFLETKKGEILIKHFGRTVTTLRGNRARTFREDIRVLPFDEQQQLMARLTGNYRRGNEKQAKNHPRNAR